MEASSHRKKLMYHRKCCFFDLHSRKPMP